MAEKANETIVVAMMTSGWSSPTLAVITLQMMWKNGTASIIMDPLPPLETWYNEV